MPKLLKLSRLLAFESICSACMLFDITISCVACARQNERKHDIPPKNSFDVFLDNKYPDEFMDKIYNNRILIEK